MSVQTPSLPAQPATLAAAAALARQMADVVTEAGALALSLFRTDLRTWTKANDSPVTEADMAVDSFLRDRLQALAPEFGWLSEESLDTADRLARHRLWVVDPIDGTRAFMAGAPDWVVSAALVEAGRPIAGVLFAPVTNEMFVAARGSGATRNGVPLSASPRTTFDSAAISGPAFMVDWFAQAAAIDRRPRVRSLALRLARVATGELDVALASGNCSDWDIAAADLIVHEANGALTGYAGAVPLYNAVVPRHAPLVCAAPRLHLPALALVGGEAGASL